MLFSPQYEFASSLCNLKAAAVDVGLNSGNVEDGHGHLRIRGLRPQLVVGIAQALADSVDANQGTSGQEVLALQAAGAHRVLLGPDAIAVLGQQLGRGQLVTGVAASGLLGAAEVCRAR